MIGRPDRLARSATVRCGYGCPGLGAHVQLLILQLPGEVAWLSPPPERTGGEDTESLRRATWSALGP